MSYSSAHRPATGRPGSVTTVVALAYVAAIWNAVQGIALLVAVMRPGDLSGMFYGAPDWYWFMLAVLELLVAGIFVAVGRGLAAGDAQSRSTAMILAAISVIFALFSLPFGFGALIIGCLVILLLNRPTAKRFFRV
jgi:hypothetical protein